MEEEILPLRSSNKQEKRVEETVSHRVACKWSMGLVVSDLSRQASKLMISNIPWKEKKGKKIREEKRRSMLAGTME